MSKINIKYIASECNVSPTTVSRVLNNLKGVSEKKRKEILEVCKKRKFKVNSLARGLIMKKSNMIGLIIPDISNSYYATISKGINTYLEKFGYGLILCNIDRNSEKEKKYLKFLMEKMVDGIIIIPSNTNKEIYQEVLDENIPMVFIDNKIEDLNVNFITNNNYYGSKKIVKHMLKRGYRKIGLILGNENSYASNERYKGYLEALFEANLKLNSEIILYSDATFESGYNLAEKLLNKKVDSIFAINDNVAIGILDYCFQNNIKIPEDIGLAGYDDIREASILPISLTTIHQQKNSLGVKAAELLIKEIENIEVIKQDIILQPELIIRKSCGE